jgi:hypothetical protein
MFLNRIQINFGILVFQEYFKWVPKGVKRGRGVMLTTHPHLVPRLNMSRSYTSSPPLCLYGI